AGSFAAFVEQCALGVVAVRMALRCLAKSEPEEPGDRDSHGTVRPAGPAPVSREEDELHRDERREHKAQPSAKGHNSARKAPPVEMHPAAQQASADWISSRLRQPAADSRDEKHHEAV